MASPTNRTVPSTLLLIACALAAAWGGSVALRPASAQVDERVTLVESVFDDDDEGWTLTTASGISLGSARVGLGTLTDEGQGAETSYWQAPTQFLGDQSRALGGELSLRLRSSTVGQRTLAPDVILEGGGMIVIGNLSPAPGLSWTEYKLPLRAGAGWFKANGTPATMVDLQTVLGEVSALRIRGRYYSGSNSATLASPRLVSAQARPPALVAVLLTTVKFNPVPLGKFDIRQFLLVNRSHEDQQLFLDYDDTGSLVVVNAENTQILRDGTSLILPSTADADEPMGVHVRFMPGKLGKHKVVIRVRDLLGVPVGKVTATGKGVKPGPVLDSDKKALSFGSVVLDTTKDQSITISHIGDELFDGTAVVSGPFTFGSGQTQIPLTMEPDQELPLVIRFKPTVVGSFKGALEIKNGLGITVLKVVLTGNGIKPPSPGGKLELNKEIIDFGTVFIDSSGDNTNWRDTIIGVNKGGNTLNVVFQPLSAPFRGLAPPNDAPLPWTRTLTPSGIGSIAGIAVEAQVVGNNPGDFEETLRVTATNGALLDSAVVRIKVRNGFTVDKNVLNFPTMQVGQQTTMTLTCTNPLVSCTAKLEGLPDGPFSTPNTEVSPFPQLPQGVQVPITFKPTSAGQFSATLEFKTKNRGVLLWKVDLHGTAISQPADPRNQQQR